MYNSTDANNEHIYIREATEKDLTAVIELDNEAFSPHGTAELPMVIGARLTIFRQGFIVLEKDRTIIGYGSSEKWLSIRDPAMNENPEHTHNSLGHIFCITAMAIKDGYRGRGYGSMILNRLRLIAIKEDCKQIILETVRAENFYLKHGFRVCGERSQMNASLKILCFDLQ